MIRKIIIALFVLFAGLHQTKSYGQHCILCSCGFYILVVKADPAINYKQLKMYLMNDSSSVAFDNQKDTIFVKYQHKNEKTASSCCITEDYKKYFDVMKDAVFTDFTDNHYFVLMIQSINRPKWLKVVGIQNKEQLIDVSGNYHILCTSYFNESIRNTKSHKFSFNQHALENIMAKTVFVNQSN